jgi:hypothetical protein
MCSVDELFGGERSVLQVMGGLVWNCDPALTGSGKGEEFNEVTV